MTCGFRFQTPTDQKVNQTLVLAIR